MIGLIAGFILGKEDGYEKGYKIGNANGNNASLEYEDKEVHKAVEDFNDSITSWKPSEEQMQALMDTLEFMPDTFKPRCTLVTLQNDLKKLI